MVTCILSYPKSVSASLGYNEEKVYRGKATIIDVQNIEESSLFGIRMAMLKRENNPAIHINTKTKALHMAINPAPKDNMDDQSAAGYTKDLLDKMGYGNQPYVLFKHSDIDRIHYHLVSVRVTREGTIIPKIIYPSLMRIQKELSIKYGFSADYQVYDKEVLGPSTLKKGMRNIVGQIEANVRAAMAFLHAGEAQLRIVLKSYGIIMHRGVKEHDGKMCPFVSFQGIDDDGKFITRPFLATKILGRPFDDIYRELHKDEPFQPIPGTISRVTSALQVSTTSQTFKSILLSHHAIKLYCVDSNGIETTDINEIKDVFFVDQRAHQCMTLAQCHLQLQRILSLYEEDEDEKKQKKAKTKTKEMEPQQIINENKVHLR